MAPAGSRIGALIDLLRDGAGFYRAAARQAPRPVARESCRRMAIAKEHLATTVCRQYPAEAMDASPPAAIEPPPVSSVGLNAGRTTARDLRGLKRAETLLLAAFERVLLESDTPVLRSALKRYLPQAESCLRTLAGS